MAYTADDDFRMMGCIWNYLKRRQAGSVSEIFLATKHKLAPGVTVRHVEHYVRLMFQNHLLRRQAKPSNPYEYRLTCDYPNWGELYHAKPAYNPQPLDRKRNHVFELCRQNSRVYQLDLLLREVRC